MAPASAETVAIPPETSLGLAGVDDAGLVVGLDRGVAVDAVLVPAIPQPGVDPVPDVTRAPDVVGEVDRDTPLQPVEKLLFVMVAVAPVAVGGGLGVVGPLATLLATVGLVETGATGTVVPALPLRRPLVGADTALPTTVLALDALRAPESALPALGVARLRDADVRVIARDGPVRADVPLPLRTETVATPSPTGLRPAVVRQVAGAAGTARPPPVTLGLRLETRPVGVEAVDGPGGRVARPAATVLVLRLHTGGATVGRTVTKTQPGVEVVVGLGADTPAPAPRRAALPAPPCPLAVAAVDAPVVHVLHLDEVPGQGGPSVAAGVPMPQGQAGEGLVAVSSFFPPRDFTGSWGLSFSTTSSRGRGSSSRSGDSS